MNEAKRILRCDKTTNFCRDPENLDGGHAKSNYQALIQGEGWRSQKSNVNESMKVLNRRASSESKENRGYSQPMNGLPREVQMVERFGEKGVLIRLLFCCSLRHRGILSFE